MTTHTLACADLVEASHLLIHAAGDDGSDGWSVESIVQRMRAHVMDGPRSERAPLSLEIQDLQGNRLLALDNAGALIDVALAPGTYHVTTELAGTRRRYTIALERGASFDLHLRPGGNRD